MSRKKIIISIIFLVIFAVGLFFSSKAYEKYQDLRSKAAVLKKREEAWERLKKSLGYKIAHFKGNVSIVVKDLDTNWEIDCNKDTLIPAASLVKVPIMLSCFYAVQEGKMQLTDAVTLKAADKVAGSKATGRHPAGSVFTVEQLLGPMITLSDNAAANALIEYMGFDALNNYFKKMGLKNTNLARKMLDFSERKEGEENYTTAEDMAFILEELYHKNFLNKDISQQCLDLLGEQKINDRIPKRLPKCELLIAHKTGLERHVCHDVGIVFTNKGDFLICVLVKHEDRFAWRAKKIISDLALLTYNYYGNL